MTHFFSTQKDFTEMFGYPAAERIAMKEVLREDAGQWKVVSEANVSIPDKSVPIDYMPHAVKRFKNGFRVAIGQHDYKIPKKFVRQVAENARTYLVLDVAGNYQVRFNDMVHVLALCFGYDEQNGTRALFSTKEGLLGGASGLFETLTPMLSVVPVVRTSPAYAPAAPPAAAKPTPDEQEEARQRVVARGRTYDNFNEDEDDWEEFSRDVKGEAEFLAKTRGAPREPPPEKKKTFKLNEQGDWVAVVREETEEEKEWAKLQKAREEVAEIMASARKSMGKEQDGVFKFEKVTMQPTAASGNSFGGNEGRVVSLFLGIYEAAKPPPGLPDNVMEVFAKRSTPEELAEERKAYTNKKLKEGTEDGKKVTRYE